MRKIYTLMKTMTLNSFMKQNCLMYVYHVRNTREVRRGEDEERDEDEGGG